MLSQYIISNTSRNKFGMQTLNKQHNLEEEKIIKVTLFEKLVGIKEFGFKIFFKGITLVIFLIHKPESVQTDQLILLSFQAKFCKNSKRSGENVYLMTFLS